MSGIEIIRPRDRTAWLAARRRDVTASQIGAVFGEHDFLTPFQLWAVKTGRAPDTIEETDAIRRGRLLEPVAVQILREEHPDWRIEHNAAENIYYRDPAHRLGATPDVIAFAPNRGKGVIQIKSVEASTYRRKWLDEDGNPDPPVWIALQASLEAYLTGAEWAAVAPLVVSYGVEMPLIEIPLVPGLIEAMRAKVGEFWENVALGNEPAPDYARDGELIAALYGDGDPEHEIDLSGDNRVPELLAERHRLVAQRRDTVAALDAIDTEVKAKMKHAHVAHLGDGRRITWKPQRRGGFYVEPTTIRALRFPSTKD